MVISGLRLDPRGPLPRSYTDTTTQSFLPTDPLHRYLGQIMGLLDELCAASLRRD
jgi:hypothetical protein